MLNDTRPSAGACCSAVAVDGRGDGDPTRWPSVPPTVKNPPPWLNLDAVVPPDLRERVAAGWAEGVRLAPSVVAWARRVREVDEAYCAAVDEAGRDLTVDQVAEWSGWSALVSLIGLLCVELDGALEYFGPDTDRERHRLRLYRDAGLLPVWPSCALNGRGGGR